MFCHIPFISVDNLYRQNLSLKSQNILSYRVIQTYMGPIPVTTQESLYLSSLSHIRSTQWVIFDRELVSSYFYNFVLLQLRTLTTSYFLFWTVSTFWISHNALLAPLSKTWYVCNGGKKHLFTEFRIKRNDFLVFLINQFLSIA